MLARDRILSARGLDTIVHDLRATEKLMASEDDAVRDKAMARYARLDAAFNAPGRVCGGVGGGPDRLGARACRTGSSSSRCVPSPAVSAAGWS